MDQHAVELSGIGEAVPIHLFHLPRLVRMRRKWRRVVRRESATVAPASTMRGRVMPPRTPTHETTTQAVDACYILRDVGPVWRLVPSRACSSFVGVYSSSHFFCTWGGLLFLASLWACGISGIA